MCVWRFNRTEIVIILPYGFAWVGVSRFCAPFYVLLLIYTCHFGFRRFPSFSVWSSPIANGPLEDPVHWHCLMFPFLPYSHRDCFAIRFLLVRRVWGGLMASFAGVLALIEEDGLIVFVSKCVARVLTSSFLLPSFPPFMPLPTGKAMIMMWS